MWLRLCGCDHCGLFCRGLICSCVPNWYAMSNTRRKWRTRESIESLNWCVRLTFFDWVASCGEIGFCLARCLCIYVCIGKGKIIHYLGVYFTSQTIPITMLKVGRVEWVIFSRCKLVMIFQQKTFFFVVCHLLFGQIWWVYHGRAVCGVKRFLIHHFESNYLRNLYDFMSAIDLYKLSISMINDLWGTIR